MPECFRHSEVDSKLIKLVKYLVRTKEVCYPYVILSTVNLESITIVFMYNDLGCIYIMLVLMPVEKRKGGKDGPLLQDYMSYLPSISCQCQLQCHMVFVDLAWCNTDCGRHEPEVFAHFGFYVITDQRSAALKMGPRTSSAASVVLRLYGSVSSLITCKHCYDSPPGSYRKRL